ncbi:MAG: toll/interleukin-1 receptor domain-containing protein [Parvibaculales bacterium]
MVENAKKIFVSHHNSDAPALGQLKSELKPFGFDCFLAHEDIETGEHPLGVIEEEIRSCEIFLYITKEESNKSAFCQQEIGMAKALNKPIITTRQGELAAPCFIGENEIQAIRYKEIDDNFFNKIYEYLIGALPPSEELKKHLKNLGIEGFSQTPRKNTIYLEYNNWNDLGYQTKFNLKIDGKEVGWVQIGYINQQKGEHTCKKLPPFFLRLQLPLFSRLFFNGNLPPKKIEGLRYLLNDVELMPKEEKKQISNEGVYKDSLFRNY